MISKRRLIVTGGNGFVAGSVIFNALDDWELHSLTRGQAPLEREGLQWHSCGLADTPRLAGLFRDLRPHAVIHTAAIADIDFSEANPGTAREVNVDYTRRLCELCREHGTRMVFCSTDTVFDGEGAPYREQDPAHPVNLYGRTKVEGEEQVARLGSLGVIARLALVMGLPMLGSGNSFLPRLIATLKAGKEVPVQAHEIRSPVDVVTLGQALVELAGSELNGIFHLAGNDRLNRLELTQRIASRLGYSPRLVVAAPAGSAPRRAPRPRDVSMDNSKARALLRTPMRSFDEGLSLVLETPHTSGE
ncbi:MAG TPA: hypothetical protein DCM86_14740 [Verrucomicrobiales bacterium]|nr:hypothetical protein [Verrucomicrobiales bacterium]